MHFGEFGEWHGTMWFFMIIFWILVIMGIIYLVQLTVHRKHKGNNSPLEILKERYAKGEITEKQYEDMKKKLKDDQE